MPSPKTHHAKRDASLWVWAIVSVFATAGFAEAQPFNDACISASPVALGGFVIGTASGATSDGVSSCSPSGLSVPDVYHTFRAGQGGMYTFSLCTGTTWDTVLSIHSACPASVANQIDCDDEGCRPSGSTTFGWPSTLTTFLSPQTSYLVRVSGFDLGAGFDIYHLSASGPMEPTGACCVGTQCSFTTANVCSVGGGNYAGNLSACLAPSLSPSTLSDTGLPAVIPDNLALGVSRALTMTSTGGAASVRVSLTLNHTWAGDLIITLSHAGRTATLLQKLRGGLLGTSVNFNGTYEFSDRAQNSMWSDAAVVADNNTAAIVQQGSYYATDASGSPVSLSQVFEGVELAGDWTLRIVDAGVGDTGMLTGFELTLDRSIGDICTTAPPVAGACCFGDVHGGLGNRCSVLTPAACTTSAGNFRGASSVCGTASTNPTTCCRANINANSGVTVQDVFDFLNAWFNGLPEGDFNGQGGATVQDVFDFLSAWFAGCSVQ